jgi:chemotaxis response regulator CheB
VDLLGARIVQALYLETMPARKMRKLSLRSGLPDEPMHVVGIGASAGGLEPLQELLQRFTADCTAFVVIMHLSPHA